MTRATTAVVVAEATPPPKPSQEVVKAASKAAAVAVLGGRFPRGVLQALQDKEFAGIASEYYTRDYKKQMEQHPESVAACKGAENVRKQSAIVVHLSDVEQHRN